LELNRHVIDKIVRYKHKMRNFLSELLRVSYLILVVANCGQAYLPTRLTHVLVKDAGL